VRRGAKVACRVGRSVGHRGAGPKVEVRKKERMEGKEKGGKEKKEKKEKKIKEKRKIGKWKRKGKRL
jgi:hypothetical protein